MCTFFSIFASSLFKFSGSTISQYPEQDLQSIDVKYSGLISSDGFRNDANSGVASADLPGYTDSSKNADQLTYLPHYQGNH